MHTTELCPNDKNECVIMLTYAHSKRDVDSMIVADIERALIRQYEQDRKQIKQNAAEMEKLRAAWMRYRDLERNTESLEERMVRIVAAVGDEHFTTLRGKDSADHSNEVSIVTGDAPLWKAMAAIIEIKPGIQVVELHHVLESLGHKTSRSAIESALATHKNDFEIRNEGRRKYVSLRKGA